MSAFCSVPPQEGRTSPVHASTSQSGALLVAALLTSATTACARRLSPRTPRTHVAVPPASARSLPRCAPHTHLLSAVSTHCAGALSVASRSTLRRRAHNGAVLRRPSSSGLGLPGPAERSRDQARIARKYYYFREVATGRPGWTSRVQRGFLDISIERVRWSRAHAHFVVVPE